MIAAIKLSSLLTVSMIFSLFFPSHKPFPESLSLSAISHELSPDFSQKLYSYTKSLPFKNADSCISPKFSMKSNVCHPSLIHIAMTLDTQYLRGSVAAVHSILQNSQCPENIFFHFIFTDTDLDKLINSIFPSMKFKTYYFDVDIVQDKISSTVRESLEQPLNYARNYLASVLEPCVKRVIYLDSDIIVVDDILKLWTTNLTSKTVGSPEFCQANFTRYFTDNFWSERNFSSATFGSRRPCYFNTGVMVIDLVSWRRDAYTEKLERWMEVQKTQRIYELGSLPPFLLVFAGNVSRIDHRWNQHGLGGDNLGGNCRKLHPGPVSLLHWSGGGKPWQRLDAGRPCPLDVLWSRYDLYRP